MMWIGTSYGQDDLNFQIQEGFRAEEHKRLVALAKGAGEDGGPGSLKRAFSSGWQRIGGAVRAWTDTPPEPQGQCC